MIVVFFKQKTAYDMRISDCSSDVCSSDLRPPPQEEGTAEVVGRLVSARRHRWRRGVGGGPPFLVRLRPHREDEGRALLDVVVAEPRLVPRSEEHTSELQSLMRISYAVFCLKKKNN